MFKATFLIAVFCAVCTAFDYCTISSSNTLCRYKLDTFGPACKQPFKIELTASDRTTIEAIHNTLRRRVAKGLEKRGNPGPQPPASNMRKLTWDDELAQMAQAWANQCTFGHDVDRNVERFPVGQNLFMSMSSAPTKKADWQAPLNGTQRSWFSEVDHMNEAFLKSFPQSATKVFGHYTAIVWAETTRFGCAATGYINPDHGSLPYQIIYVCDYGKAGNWIGAPAYKIGPPASDCPKGSIPVDGLCA